MPQLTLYPYLLDERCWVFDDEKFGLKEEAFVLGMTEIISKVVGVKRIPNAERGFALTFSAAPFDHDLELTWVSVAEANAAGKSALPGMGDWYRAVVDDETMFGWLCPALFLYFNQAPRIIYVKAAPLPAGLDPIWHVDPNAPIARRYMSASGKFEQ